MLLSNLAPEEMSMKRTMTPRQAAAMAVSRLRAMADPSRAAQAQRYFKETVRTYGASSGEVRALAAEIYADVRGSWTVADAVALCDLLFPARELETKGVAAVILAKFKKDFPRSLCGRVKGWLMANHLDNWASVDVFCPEVMGALIVKYPELAAQVASWAAHSNRWVKRASAVSFLKLAKYPENLDVIYRVARSLFGVDDDLIQKANGWLLREAGKTDPGRLETFLLEAGPDVPRTTLRYAIERFSQAKRKALLVRTRGNRAAGRRPGRGGKRQP